MKKLYVKDQRKRRVYLDLFLQHLCLKSIQHNLNFSKHQRWGAFVLLSDAVHSTRISQLKNRCVLSNRGRGVLGHTFKLSRIFIRNLLAQGLISGLVKKSW
jgi:small subunit ribosomal protein S14